MAIDLRRSTTEGNLNITYDSVGKSSRLHSEIIIFKFKIFVYIIIYSHVFM